MQKKLIAIVVAAAFAPAVAAADTGNVNVYGRLHASVDSIDNGDANQNSSLFVNTNSSRFGVRGSEDLGGGTSAIFQIESNVNLTGTGNGGNGNRTANSPSTSINSGAFGGQVRDTYVGLKGGLGTIQIGRLAQENHWVYEMNLFADQPGDLGNMTSPIGGRSDGEILYTTPTFQGFTANAQMYPASSHAADGTIGSTRGTKNGWGTKINYNAMGVNASFNYLNRNNGATALYTPIVLSASYDFGAGLIGGQYMRDRRESIGGAADTSAKRNIFNVGGLYRVTPAVSIKGQFSKAGDVTGTSTGTLTIGSNTGARMTALGVDYAFSKRTTAYLSYARTDNDSAAQIGVANNGHNDQMPTFTVGQDPRAFAVGLTHNF
jgi:predicted porin